MADLREPARHTLAWPFLVARGRHHGYRTLLAPDVLLRDGDHGILDEVVVPSEDEGQVSVTDVATRAGRHLAVVYATHRVTAGDIVEPGTAPTGAGAPRDQHSRPLQFMYGFVYLDGQVLATEPSDLRTCLGAALRVYRRFLADEDDFPVQAGTAFSLHSQVARRSPSHARSLRGRAGPPSIGGSGTGRPPRRGIAGYVATGLARSPVLLTLALIAVVLGLIWLAWPSSPSPGTKPTIKPTQCQTPARPTAATGSGCVEASTRP